MTLRSSVRGMVRAFAPLLARVIPCTLLRARSWTLRPPPSLCVPSVLFMPPRYYLFLNIGAVCGESVCPLLREHVGYYAPFVAIVCVQVSPGSVSPGSVSYHHRVGHVNVVFLLLLLLLLDGS
jgi:hypothetical protein